MNTTSVNKYLKKHVKASSISRRDFMHINTTVISGYFHLPIGPKYIILYMGKKVL